MDINIFDNMLLMILLLYHEVHVPLRFDVGGWMIIIELMGP